MHLHRADASGYKVSVNKLCELGRNMSAIADSSYHYVGPRCCIGMIFAAQEGHVNVAKTILAVKDSDMHSQNCAGMKTIEMNEQINDKNGV